MVCVGIVLMVVFAAVVIILLDHRRVEKTMDQLDMMLDLAIKEAYVEQEFDESRLSALGTKFAHFLSASVVSAKNVQEEKDRIKSLIADISHQTKTPIANLLLYCELLAEQELPEEAGEYTEAIRRQAGKLRFLIDSLVKMSRLENGIMVLHPTEEMVHPLLETIVEEYQPKAMEKGLDLILQESDAYVQMDGKWTKEAVSNIIENAIKYTDRGSVVIAVVPYEMFVKIDISDTGRGICEEEQTKIFSRFYRSEQSCEQEGVGIGLYLAREIIRAEGGYIRVNSELGKGSVFSIFLPAANLSKL